MATRFNLGQRVNTPLGEGTIDTLPYNEESTIYGVWLDKAYFIGVRANHWLPLDEDKLTPINWQDHVINAIYGNNKED